MFIIRVLGCFPSLMQAWIRRIIPSLFVCFAANRHQKLIMILSPFGRLASFFERFKVLRKVSALRAFGFASLCLHNSTNPLRVLSKTQPRLDDEYTYGRKNRVLAIVWFKGKTYAMLFLSKIRCVLSRKGYFLIQKYASLHSLQKYTKITEIYFGDAVAHSIIR